MKIEDYGRIINLWGEVTPEMSLYVVTRLQELNAKIMTQLRYRFIVQVDPYEMDDYYRYDGSNPVTCIYYGFRKCDVYGIFDFGCWRKGP